MPGKKEGNKKIVLAIKFDHTPEKFKLLLLMLGFINVLHKHTTHFLRLVAKIKTVCAKKKVRLVGKLNICQFLREQIPDNELF